MDKLRKQIIQVIERSNQILLMPSTPVDGDSLGSSLALYLALKKLGKQVTVVCSDPVPDSFKFLPTTAIISDDFNVANDFIVTLDCQKAKIKTIRTALEQDKVNIIITAKKGQFSSNDVSFHHGPSKYDLIITVDTADLQQLGRFYEDNPELFVTIPLINIDHHASNDNFGKINLVDILSSATTEIIMPLIENMEEHFKQDLFDEDIATLLLAGIITDTGSFQNSNTTPRSFAASAKLIKYGARQQEIIQHVFKTKHLSTLKLWGRILTKLKVDKEHRLVWSEINKKDFMDTESSEEETGGIIDELMTNAPDADIVLLLKQKKENLITGSMRTLSPSVDASNIAEMFGGGGHPQAAGFRIESDDFDKTVQDVIAKIKKYQEEKGVRGFEDMVMPETVSVEETTVDREKTTKKKDEVHKSTKIKKEKPVDKKTPTKKSVTADDESFTDVIMKKQISDPSETDLEPGVTYKFED